MPLRVSVYLGVSLDLRIAHADGSLDFLLPYQRPDEDYGYPAFLAGVDAVVLGRHTFDWLVGYDGPWPFGERAVTVLTHRPLPAATPATVRAYSGVLGTLLDAMAEAGLRHVYLDGGLAVRQGLQEGRVDELILSVVPEVVGAGRTLFDETVPRSHWRLISSTPFPSGLVQLRYGRGEHTPVSVG